MELLDASAILLTLAALFSYVNHRWIKLPTTIGIMLISLVMSLMLIGVGQFLPDMQEAVDRFVTEIDFNKALMNGMLSFLLFAGALHVNLHELKKQRRIVGIMASAGVVLSTLLIGSASYGLFQLLGIEVPWIWCLVFGALISPTDPVAVLGILKRVGAPKSLETKITGESLFNDGVGVVVYLSLLGMAGVGGHGSGHHGAGDIAMLFVKEAGGGIVLGGVLGWLCYTLLKSIDHYHVEILLTLALVLGGYRLAMMLHLSGPLAMVVAGLMIGNHAREDAMSEKTRLQVDTFWELIDEILNALLFLLIGLEIFVLDFSGPVLVAGLLLIPVTLMARFIAVSIPVTILRRWRVFTPGVSKILTWGGIRGGISVALALAIPTSMGEVRDAILLVTYVIVIFSIAVQGMTLKPMIARAIRRGQSGEAGGATE
ncbi:MAG: sodium:proton antiporter [Verrucomicrobiae bacterium]|nr:sodium:proton antiporter [Verrucomicrobiae bacterium]NNJ42300.1 sodium:proton antiporter [Akkermansiaceae bacterium]